MSDQAMADAEPLSDQGADTVSVAFASIREAIASQKAALGTMERALRSLERETRRLKQTARAAKRIGGRPRRPTGFACPGAVSAELLEFLGRQPGEKVARTDATRAINAYIKEHRLQDTANARHIVPDTKLAALLLPDPGTELTYFNLQQHMNRHFLRSTPDDST